MPSVGERVDAVIMNFPSGCEPHIKISDSRVEGNEVTVFCRTRNLQDLFLCFLAKDALERKGATKVHLYIPYLPFARQDRVMVDGEPLSIKVLANIINSQGFSSVSILDPHSDVSPALIDRCKIAYNYLWHYALSGKKRHLLVSPDAGAYKKVSKIASSIKGHDGIVVCQKTRDVATGQLTGFEVDSPLIRGRECFILDDICDGGGTFVGIAEALISRGAEAVYLVVTHGIFSKGVNALVGIDHIYTTNSFQDVNHNKVTQYKI